MIKMQPHSSCKDNSAVNHPGNEKEQLPKTGTTNGGRSVVHNPLLTVTSPKAKAGYKLNQAAAATFTLAGVSAINGYRFFSRDNLAVSLLHYGNSLTSPPSQDDSTLLWTGKQMLRGLSIGVPASLALGAAWTATSTLTGVGIVGVSALSMGCHIAGHKFMTVPIANKLPESWHEYAVPWIQALTQITMSAVSPGYSKNAEGNDQFDFLGMTTTFHAQPNPMHSLYPVPDNTSMPYARFEEIHQNKLYTSPGNPVSTPLQAGNSGFQGQPTCSSACAFRPGAPKTMNSGLMRVGTSEATFTPSVARHNQRWKDLLLSAQNHQALPPQRQTHLKEKSDLIDYIHSTRDTGWAFFFAENQGLFCTWYTLFSLDQECPLHSATANAGHFPTEGLIRLHHRILQDLDDYASSAKKPPEDFSFSEAGNFSCNQWKVVKTLGSNELSDQNDQARTVVIMGTTMPENRTYSKSVTVFTVDSKAKQISVTIGTEGFSKDEPDTQSSL